MEGHHHSSSWRHHPTDTNAPQGHHERHHNQHHSPHNQYQRQCDYSQSLSSCQPAGIQSYAGCLPFPTPDFPPGLPCLGSHGRATPPRYPHPLYPPNFRKWPDQPQFPASNFPLLSPQQPSWCSSQPDERWNRRPPFARGHRSAPLRGDLEPTREDRQRRITSDQDVNYGPLQPSEHQHCHAVSNTFTGGSEFFKGGHLGWCGPGGQLDGRLPSQSLDRESIGPPAASSSKYKKARTCLESSSRSHRPLRPMVEVNKELKLKHTTRLLVLSYNVLAQSLLENNMHLYDQHHPDDLDWDVRKINLLTELAQSSADILCLQEVEKNHFHDWFQPELERLGYTGRFMQRTGSCSDGCALFYMKSKLNLVDWNGVEFQRRTAVLNRDNVAILAKFAIVDNEDALFCVAITHLLFNPKAGEVKLAQLAYLFAELHKMASNSGSEDIIPVLLCGDLNSTPHSHLINFITTSALDYSNLSAKTIAGYFENDGWKRAIPKPLLPQEMCIKANCTYDSPRGKGDKKREGLGQRTSHSGNPKGSVKHVSEDVEEVVNKSGQPDTVCTVNSPSEVHSEFKPEEKSIDCQLLKVMQSARGRRRAANKTYKEVDVSAIHSLLNSDSTGTTMKRTRDHLSTLRSSSSEASSVDELAMDTKDQPAEENGNDCQILMVTQRAGFNESDIDCQILKVTPRADETSVVISEFKAEENSIDCQILKVTQRADESSASGMRQNCQFQPCRTEDSASNRVQKESSTTSRKKEDPSSSWSSSKATAASGCGSQDSGHLSHLFKLISAYPHPNLSMPSTVTTYHQNAFETVDYMLYSPMTYRTVGSRRQLTGFHLLQRLALPSTHTLLDLGPQPHKHLPSDHLLLQGTFQFTW